MMKADFWLIPKTNCTAKLQVHWLVNHRFIHFANIEKVSSQTSDNKFYEINTIYIEMINNSWMH